MNFKISVVILFTAFIQSTISGQPDTYFLSTKVVGQNETYSVKKAPFSTDKYDEFSPVCYRNSIIFCSNRPITKVMNLSTEQNKGMIKINAFDSLGQGYAPTVKLFSKSLNTKLNDGPVSFNSRGDTIYFSKNLNSDGKLSELSSVRNKLGIFYAVFDGQEWTKIRELRFNSEWYNITTPWISPDGKRLYFASDKPGGYGGSDIYYCSWKIDYWDEPVNLGPIINTKGNESYPFVNGAGEFFFSSDGHPGLGGKDIFFSRLLSDSTWIEPVCLDAPINSTHDDFGIFTDTLMNEGYFSSNRDKSIDIFQFTTNYSQIFYNTIQKDNNYCFTFRDNKAIVLDSLNLRYKWSFGDGKPVAGSMVSHCFPGPGKYVVSLDIVERETGKLFFTKLIENIQIRDFEQPYIESPGFAVKGEKISFDALKSYLPGFRILSYSWDFGDKSRDKGEKVTHSYKESGEYPVNLEVALKSDSTGMIKKTGISRKIVILNTTQEVTALKTSMNSENIVYPDVNKSDNTIVKTKYMAESESQKDAVFSIELISSKTKLGVNNEIFRNVPDVYTIRERFDPLSGEYSYTVEQYLNLMSALPGYRRMGSLGFKDSKVKMFLLTDPSERELYNLIRINGAFADSYFDFADRLTSNALIMLDQMVKYMNKFPSVRIELAVHSDNMGSPESNKALSQKRSQILVDYLINRGINSKRLVAKGYGGSKPIASNILEKDRKLNRRIDFTIINK
jgi:outer membrane protein OmpA-like peptidoglycan-associated protein